MLSVRATISEVLLAMASAGLGQSAPPDTGFTVQLDANLVFLDVTVLDKQGKPVVTGLTKDDFVITEEREQQPIFSFEAPDVHVTAGGENPDGKAPVTIFVLDRLNSDSNSFNGDFEQFGYLYEHLRMYLASQPKELPAPAELMVMGNNSLELLQGYTRSRDDLLFALDHMPGTIPYKALNSGFDAERFQQTIGALQQIALQNKGIPGRKNIVWVGHGAPSMAVNP